MGGSAQASAPDFAPYRDGNRERVRLVALENGELRSNA